MQPLDIIILVIIILALIGFIIYRLNKKAYGQLLQAQKMIDQNKMTTSIFVIHKKKDKAANVKLPKVVLENMSKWQKSRKLYFVQAKVGPQISTLICEKDIFEILPVKKNVKVDLAGIYIVDVKGIKREQKKKSWFTKARESALSSKKDKK